MGTRMAVDIWSNTSSGSHWFLQFSLHHDITSGQAYVTAFVLMAVFEVLLRVGTLQWRRIHLSQSPTPLLQR